MSTITARLESWLRDDLERFWKSRGEGPSTGLRRIAEEWWAMEHYPTIAFRDGVSGRRAILRSGPDVWEVVMVARDYGDDRNALREHFGESVSHEALDQALAYAERFPEEVEAMIAENERMERLLAARGESFPGVLFFPTSIRHGDVEGHARALLAWLRTANAAGANPVANGFGWLSATE